MGCKNYIDFIKRPYETKATAVNECNQLQSATSK